MPKRGPAVLSIVMLLVLPAVPHIAAASECAANASEITIHDSVSRAQTFARPLPYDLAFQLRPLLQGWLI